VVAWNQLAEQCNEWLAKGRRIYVEGRLKSNTWTGQDGTARFNNEVIAQRVLFLDKESARDTSEDNAEKGDAVASIQGDAEDIPW